MIVHVCTNKSLAITINRLVHLHVRIHVHVHHTAQLFFCDPLVALVHVHQTLLCVTGFQKKKLRLTASHRPSYPVQPIYDVKQNGKWEESPVYVLIGSDKTILPSVSITIPPVVCKIFYCSSGTFRRQKIFVCAIVCTKIKCVKISIAVYKVYTILW